MSYSHYINIRGDPRYMKEILTFGRPEWINSISSLQHSNNVIIVEHTPNPTTGISYPEFILYVDCNDDGAMMAGFFVKKREKIDLKNMSV